MSYSHLCIFFNSQNFILKNVQVHMYITSSPQIIDYSRSNFPVYILIYFPIFNCFYIKIIYLKKINFLFIVISISIYFSGSSRYKKLINKNWWATESVMTVMRVSNKKLLHGIKTLKIYFISYDNYFIIHNSLFPLWSFHCNTERKFYSLVTLNGVGTTQC